MLKRVSRGSLYYIPMELFQFAPPGGCKPLSTSGVALLSVLNVMLNSDDLAQWLKELSGSDADPPVMVRDTLSPLGWRPWTSEDGPCLCQWIVAKMSEGAAVPGPPSCCNLKEAARRVGVSVPKMQMWLRRRDHPLPHIKDGRLILIYGPQLGDWLRDEAVRNINSRI